MKEFLLAVALFGLLVFAILSPNALTRVAQYAGQLEQISTPYTLMADADELAKVARLVADKYATDNKLDIFSTTPVNVVENGKLQVAVEVVFAGNVPLVYCFADGHCRRLGTW